MKLGFLYAGQGSQHPGMGADLYERFPTFRAVLDSAAAQVDFDLKEVSFTDTKGVLNQTRYTQPCMVAFAAGMTALLAERFRTVEFREPQIPVIFNCLGAERPDGAVIPELLVQQVQSSVYMEDSLRRMAAMGGRAGGDRPGQGPQRLCEENRPGAVGVRRGDRGRAGTADGDPQRSISMNFSEKTAVVTGGSRGLGRAICLELARGGANVVLCYAGNEVAANETVAACESLWGQGRGRPVRRVERGRGEGPDGRRPQNLWPHRHSGEQRGITRDGLLMMMKPEDFDAVIAANLRGAFLCMKAVARQMVKQRYGRIVNLSSVVASGATPDRGELRRQQSGRHRHDETRQGAGGTEHHRQRRGPGFIDTDMTAALSETAKTPPSAPFPWAAWARRKTWPRPWAFSRRGRGLHHGQVLAVDGGMSM